LTEVNADLLRRVVKRIERDLDTWDQRYWANRASMTDMEWEREEISDAEETFVDQYSAPCGTTFCLAGHTIMEAGEKVRFKFGFDEASTCLTAEGERVPIPQRAKELLGLSQVQADILFGSRAGGDDFDYMKQIITRLTGVKLD
jgi:hypothetical protein